MRAARADGGVRAARADRGSGGCEPHGLMMGGMGMVGIVGGVGAKTVRKIYKALIFNYVFL